MVGCCLVDEGKRLTTTNIQAQQQSRFDIILDSKSAKEGLEREIKNCVL
jgi:hypothetical protein